MSLALVVFGAGEQFAGEADLALAQPDQVNHPGFPALGGQLQALCSQLLACVRGGLFEREINAGLFTHGPGGFVGLHRAMD